jgi:hypothetical protein
MRNEKAADAYLRWCEAYYGQKAPPEVEKKIRESFDGIPELKPVQGPPYATIPATRGWDHDTGISETLLSIGYDAKGKEVLVRPSLWTPPLRCPRRFNQAVLRQNLIRAPSRMFEQQ